MNDQGAGFGLPTNKVTIINKDMELKSIDLKLKSEIAKDILNYILEFQKK